MALVVVPGRVLQYKYTIIGQHMLLEHQHGDIINILQRIGWPGKYKVELLCVLFHEPEHIAFDDMELLCNTQFFDSLFDEVDIAHIALNEGKVARAARGQLVADTARAAKQVAGLDILQVYHVCQRVEQAFFGYIGSGARGCARRRTELPSPELASYNPHAYNCCIR